MCAVWLPAREQHGPDSWVASLWDPTVLGMSAQFKRHLSDPYVRRKKLLVLREWSSNCKQSTHTYRMQWGFAPLVQVLHVFKNRRLIYKVNQYVTFEKTSVCHFSLAVFSFLSRSGKEKDEARTWREERDQWLLETKSLMLTSLSFRS